MNAYEATLDLLSREVLVNLEAKRLRLGPRPEACADVLRALGLEGVINYIDTFNPSAGAPYHNAQHEAAVVTLVYEAGLYHNLGRRELRALVVAAAMHDFDHSAGALPDSKNIEAAVEGLYLLHTAVAFTSSAITDSETALAEQLIRVTQYPYISGTNDLLEDIMRDADLMMPMLADPLRADLFKGLAREMQATKSFTKQEFADGIIDFFKKVVWHSTWAVEKAATQGWPHHLESLHAVLGH